MLKDALAILEFANRRKTAQNGLTNSPFIKQSQRAYYIIQLQSASLRSVFLKKAVCTAFTKLKKRRKRKPLI